jgi:hypothetical protein
MKKLFILMVILMASVSSFALFRTYDQVFVLAAADTAGGGGTYWQTDAWVTNPGDTSVVLTIELLPRGEAGNPTPNDPDSRLHIDWPTPIAAKATLFIPNVIAKIKETYPTAPSVGALVFYGEKISGDIANIVVTTRTYTPKDASNPALGYFGQDIPGTPSYYYIDSAYSELNLDAHWLVGLTENSAFRTNVGIVNGSQNHVLDVKMELYDAAGTKVNEITLTGIGALAHVQYDQILKNKFGLQSATDYSMRVSIAKATVIDASLPYAPALYTYGSKVDQMTGDPNYIEATYYVDESFTNSYINCVWPLIR